jgi:hypothetical protein
MVFVMTFEISAGIGRDFDFPPDYPPTSYEQAVELPPEEGLHGFGDLRPYAIRDTERGAVITGLDRDGQVVERVLGDMPGIVEAIGEHVGFAYAHRALEPRRRIVKPLGVWRGIHGGHTGQAPAWYLIAEDRARQDPTTGIVTAIDEPSVKYFSLTCFQGGPVGDAADPDFRVSQGLPVIA